MLINYILTTLKLTELKKEEEELIELTVESILSYNPVVTSNLLPLKKMKMYLKLITKINKNIKPKNKSPDLELLLENNE